MCDDFEEVSLNLNFWAVNTFGGAIQIDAQEHHSGTRALHVHVDPVAAGTYGQAFVDESSTLPATTISAYTRAFFFIPVLSPYVNTLMQFVQGVAPNNNIDVNVTSAGHMELYNTVANLDQTLSAMPKVGQWFCVEWEVDFTAPQQSKLWLDGNPLTDLTTAQATESNPPLGIVNIGTLLYYPTTNLPAYDMWIDDVVIDNKPIGCN
jgi:hypothetical protein